MAGIALPEVLTLISALSLAILTPGPAIIATARAAAAHGRAHALPYALGLATGASLWCLVALLGLAIVFRLNPVLFSAMKVFGGVYLLWFAWSLWRAATEPLAQAARGPARGALRGFPGGIALNLSNPKPALFYATLILSVFPRPLPPGDQTQIYGICLATELFWYSLIAVLMSTGPIRSRYFAAQFWIDRSCAVAMAALGSLLIIGH